MLFYRDILKNVKKVLNREESIILSGARQTGKTSILIMLKEFLENKGQPCYYFNLENPDYLELLNKHPFNIFELIPDSKVKLNIFIDEIQYLDDPTNFLKLLFDEKRDKLKIIASGSSAFYIDKKFKDSLSGRKFLFEVYPLNFDEFLVFNNQKDLITKKGKKLTTYYKNKILEFWEKYLIYGAYPKVALEKDVEIKKIIIEELISSYVKKDVMDAGIKNQSKYFTLLKILALQSGQLVNVQELANTLDMTNKTIKEYLYIISKSYQATFIKPFYKNIRKELTKMPKVYFYDLGLRNFLLGNFEAIKNRENKGAYLENIVFREFLNQEGSFDKIKFWRTQDQKEIDFIVDNNAYEIKFDGKRVNIKKYQEFQEVYPQMELIFLSFDEVLEKFYGYKI